MLCLAEKDISRHLADDSTAEAAVPVEDRHRPTVLSAAPHEEGAHHDVAKGDDPAEVVKRNLEYGLAIYFELQRLMIEQQQ
jgi:hypothetical protein